MQKELSKAKPDAGRRKRTGARALGAYLPRIAKAAFEAHGFPSAAVLSDWPVIAGDDLAGFTAPERLVWPRQQAEETSESSRRPVGATLVLRVDGPRAIEVQHCTPQIIERINGYFGYRAVASVRIIQGPVQRESRDKVDRPDEPAPDEAGLERIDDEGLRAALARLGARIT